MRDNGTTQAIARSIMSSAVLALLFVVGGAAPAHAQAALLGPGAAYLGIGASGMATGELDDALAARGYPTFGRTALAVNLGAYRILSSGVMLGAEWHGLIMGEQAHHENEVGLGGGYGTLGSGSMLKVSPRARLYPRSGLGGGGMGVWRDNDSGVAFDEILANPEASDAGRRELVLSRVSPVLDIGIGAELLPRGRGRGPLIGVRLGYLAAPVNTDWELYDHSVVGGPAASIGGPYIRGVIGVGWRR